MLLYVYVKQYSDCFMWNKNEICNMLEESVNWFNDLISDFLLTLLCNIFKFWYSDLYIMEIWFGLHYFTDPCQADNGTCTTNPKVWIFLFASLYTAFYMYILAIHYIYV